MYNSFIGIIPARYASTRFPGKPLAIINGVTMIERVYQRVRDLFDEVIVATDHHSIAEVVEQFGGKVIFTSPAHASGTDRCFEAYIKNGKPYNVIVNIQGDEPFIQPSQIETLKDCFSDPLAEIATLIKPFSPDDSLEILENPNSPKVIINSENEAVYFSRSVIPYIRGVAKTDWLKCHTFYKHIGLYAYRATVLAEITQLQPSTLEKAESLEQLRWIEAGYRIKIGFTQIETIGIDTPEDLKKITDQ
ncbi:MAG: 3-deoxy-manno-octulosonate cytidylyltransferase [Bacteroidales bacterium]|jgi:3-deoxy-manno-octulosonate cytidylyltransferase (CMP-KDO synthetase)|nr:3-deoxy-manno-octulosonate cytidylyltransferase [Bacteroidales bacterium]